MASRSEVCLLGDLPLESGVILPDAKLAFVTYGDLAPGGRNAVLLTHGYTSSHRFAEDGEQPALEESWAELVGPGKSIDTSELFVVASNVLGSCYGSTGPASANPATSRPYGPDFPAITLVDMLRAQHLLLEHLGVSHLVAVVGPSYGGVQAFQWAVSYPDFMDCIVPAVSGPSVPGVPSSAALIEELAKDPNWNGGHYYDRGGVVQTLIELRIKTLKQYGLEAYLRRMYPDQARVDQEIRRQAEAWARVFDANSLIVLRNARRDYDVTKSYSLIKARVMLVLSRTDTTFPPTLAPAAMLGMREAGVDACCVEIDSEYGHMAAGLDAAKWSSKLRTFIRDSRTKSAAMAE